MFIFCRRKNDSISSSVVKPSTSSVELENHSKSSYIRQEKPSSSYLFDQKNLAQQSTSNPASFSASAFQQEYLKVSYLHYIRSTKAATRLSPGCQKKIFYDFNQFPFLLNRASKFFWILFYLRHATGCSERERGRQNITKLTQFTYYLLVAFRQCVPFFHSSITEAISHCSRSTQRSPQYFPNSNVFIPDHFAGRFYRLEALDCVD